ncbi:hypothetical protein J2Z69_002936 [Paenibacillus shirakamiensis]|uniref:DUF3937 domain-containing protein n=1 Tax=Paenibacillus shirakamiensis TaxID=1265935 RepID=A0ABS4JLC1_9BACL|nr:hypothetical protein [Paenibacillus shirakamiensis]MBP2001880.1 hypothetical protein [Paenibacillus shirakamiensis]
MLRKYVVILSLAISSYAYLVLMDVITGIGWQSSFVNAPYQLFALSEKIMALVLLGFLVVPDIYTVIRARKNKSQSPADSSS